MDWVYAQMFVRNSVFCAAHFTYTLSQPSTSVRNATNLWTFCFRDYLCPWRVSLPCDALSLDHNILSNLYFYASYTYFAPFLCFFSKGLIY